MSALKLVCLTLHPIDDRYWPYCQKCHGSTVDGHGVSSSTIAVTIHNTSSMGKMTRWAFVERYQCLLVVLASWVLQLPVCFCLQSRWNTLDTLDTLEVVVQAHAGGQETNFNSTGVGVGGFTSELFNHDGVDYIFCGEDMPDWVQPEKSLAINSDVDHCSNSISPLIRSEVNLKPLLFYIQPPNETKFYEILWELSVQLATYGTGSVQNDPLIRKQSPIFIFELEGVVANGQGHAVERLQVNISRSPCFPLTSLVFLTATTDPSTSGNLWELYCTDEDLQFQRVTSSRSRPELPLYLGDLRNIVWRRQNLHACKLKVLAKNEPENDGEATLGTFNGEHTFVGGLAVEFLRNIQYGLNFTVVPVDGDKCMDEGPDGNLTGIGRQIVTGEADLSLTLSTFESYRLRWLSFLQPAPSPHLYAFFHQPPRGLFRNIFVEPICPWIWMALGCTWIGVMLSAWLILKLNPKSETGLCTEEIIVWATGALCQQSWTRTPSTTTMRILFTITFLTSMTVFIVYSASIVSLGLYSQRQPVDSFEDLEHFGYRLTGRFAKRHNFTRDWNPAEDFLRRLHDRGSEHDGPDFLDHMHESIMEDDDHKDQSLVIYRLFEEESPHEHYAHTEMMSRFHAQMKHLNFTDDDFCTLDRIEIPGQLYQVGMFIRKRSPLQEFINYRLMYAIERGVDYRLVNMFLQLRVPWCGHRDPDEVPKMEAFSTIDANMVYKILVVGSLLATMIMFLEYYYVHHVKNMVDKGYDLEY